MFAAALLAAGAAVAPTAARADSPVTLPPLAAGEVLLEVDGLGIVRTPATFALINAVATGRGTTEAEARRALDAEIQRLTGLARAAGAAPADVQVRRSGAGISGIGSLRAFDVEEPAPGGEDASPPEPRHHAHAAITVRLRDAARAGELQAGMTGEGMEMHAYGTAPSYVLEDDSAARREARSRAVAAARADAEALAASVGMRIVRMLRVTERAGLDFLPMMVTEGEAAHQFEMHSKPRDGQVTTRAVVGIDFVLAPR